MRERGNINSQNINSRKLLLDIIKTKYDGDKWEEEHEEKVKIKILNFSVLLTKKWTQSNRTLNIFVKKNSDWLKMKFKLPQLINHKNNITIARPKILFLESSDSTKKTKVNHIVNFFTSPELVSAMSTKFHKSGKRNAANVLNEAISTPKRATKIKKNVIKL